MGGIKPPKGNRLRKVIDRKNKKVGKIKMIIYKAYYSIEDEQVEKFLPFVETMHPSLGEELKKLWKKGEKAKVIYALDQEGYFHNGLLSIAGYLEEGQVMTEEEWRNEEV